MNPNIRHKFSLSFAINGCVNHCVNVNFTRTRIKGRKGRHENLHIYTGKKKETYGRMKKSTAQDTQYRNEEYDARNTMEQIKRRSRDPAFLNRSSVLDLVSESILNLKLLPNVIKLPNLPNTVVRRVISK